jgi:hypothetical protein
VGHLVDTHEEAVVHDPARFQELLARVSALCERRSLITSMCGGGVRHLAVEGQLLNHPASQGTQVQAPPQEVLVSNSQL